MRPSAVTFPVMFTLLPDQMDFREQSAVEWPQVLAHIYTHIQGIEQTLSSNASHNTYICQKKEEQPYIAVGTLKMSIEPSGKN